MTEEFGKIGDMIAAMVTDTTSSMIAFAPKLAGALLLLIAGWLIAKLVQIVLERSIRVGLDGVLERAGVAASLENSGISATPSAIVGRVAFWLLIILFVMGASEVIGLSAVSNAINRILGYIPSVVSAAIVLAAGIFLARFVGNLVVTGAEAAGISYAAGLGAVARSSIVVMVGVVTVEQLGIDTQIIVTVITVTVAAIAFGMALAFALGARGVFEGILASHYLRQSIAEGTSIEVGDRRGVVEEIGPMSTLLRDGDQTIRVPNQKMIGEIIKQ